jgi:hypothetical protein
MWYARLAAGSFSDHTRPKSKKVLITNLIGIYELRRSRVYQHNSVFKVLVISREAISLEPAQSLMFIVRPIPFRKNVIWTLHRFVPPDLIDVEVALQMKWSCYRQYLTLLSQQPETYRGHPL